jgi:AcrR family transcriptional regulator
MSRDDWLFDNGRRALATERIYAMATELILVDGLDAFSIDTLAAHTNCSRATIYRYVGGKKNIREAVLARAAARITDIVRESVEGRPGPDRILTAIEVAVASIRSDPAGQLFVDSARGGLAARWILRLVLSLVFWPDADPHEEHEMLDRFVAPAFTESG